MESGFGRRMPLLGPSISMCAPSPRWGCASAASIRRIIPSLAILLGIRAEALEPVFHLGGRRHGRSFLLAPRRPAAGPPQPTQESLRGDPTDSLGACDPPDVLLVRGHHGERGLLRLPFDDLQDDLIGRL